MTTLANISTMQLASNLSKAKAVQKPFLFKEEQDSKAQQFLAAFIIWAMAQETTLNTVDQQGNAVTLYDPEWIWAALSYLQDNVAIWAAPAMKEFSGSQVLFKGQ